MRQWETSTNPLEHVIDLSNVEGGHRGQLLPSRLLRTGSPVDAIREERVIEEYSTYREYVDCHRH